MKPATDLHARFCLLLDRYGNMKELSRQSGLSYRAIIYKRDGERPVRTWDVWALERALQIKHANH